LGASPSCESQDSSQGPSESRFQERSEFKLQAEYDTLILEEGLSVIDLGRLRGIF